MERILIVKLSSIGDVVHTLPVLRTIRHNLPNAYIAWVVEEKAKAILDGNRDLDKIIAINTKRWRKSFNGSAVREFFDVVNILRKDKFDIAIDLQGLLKSGIISYLSRATTIIGFDSRNCREFLNILFTNKKVSPGSRDIHVVDKNLSLLNPLGFKEIKREFFLNSSLPDDRYIDEFLSKRRKEGKPLIAINPGAGWRTKEWGIKNYAVMCNRLISEIGADVIFTMGPGEEGIVKGIVDSMSYEPIVAPPTSLKQLIALLKRCSFFIGGDTGPLHLAAALNISTVAIYGPSDPARNGPYGDNHIIIHKKLDCSGCYKRNCNKIKCMEMISVDDVFEGVKELSYLKTERRIYANR
jgi:lipopolysaccharide heptosyltransferase I